LRASVETVFVEVGDDHVACAGVADDGDGHEADGAGAGDEHVFAEDRERERGVDGVAEGIEDGGDSSSMPSWWRQMLVMGSAMYSAKAPGRLTPTPCVYGAEMAAAGEAVAAASAGDVAFAADEVAGIEVGDVGADFGDFADEFVADDQGRGWSCCAQSSHL
jgi:hypothetical protein